MKPEQWSDRIVLFAAFLINNNLRSQTVKTYISALRSILAEDGIKLSQDNFLLTSLTRACRLRNDKVIHRLPIYKGLLHLILNELEKHFDKLQQIYLKKLYKAMFLSAYYGLLRAGEVAKGSHVLKAKDVHIGKNKRKLLYILWTSKTHTKGCKPQMIKINSQPKNTKKKKKSSINRANKHCPYLAMKQYLRIRPEATSANEQFFVFRDGSPVTPNQLRSTLKMLLKNLNIESKLYNLHSFRIGRCTDLYKLGVSVETIKKIGRWKSNTVFKYLRD